MAEGQAGQCKGLGRLLRRFRWKYSSLDMVEKLHLVIDTDGGVDDAGALLLALTSSATVHAITTVHGNTATPLQAAANVQRVLRLFPDRSDVPIVPGSSGPIIKDPSLAKYRATFYHGQDGLGDVPEVEPRAEDFQPATDAHAVNTIIRLSKEVGELTLVCLGPLTNVALALKLHPELGKGVRKLFLMGGNLHATGNVHGASTAEFNFFSDPEAAKIVLEELGAPICAVPWEAYLRSAEEKATSPRTDAFLFAKDSKRSALMEAVSRKGRRWCEERGLSYGLCDELAMAAALNPAVVTETQEVSATVELAGQRTRGQVAVDWMAEGGFPANLTFCSRLNVPAVAQMLLDAVKEDK